MAEQFYTTEEAAAHLKIKVTTMRAYLNRGKIRGVKQGGEWRIPDTFLQEYIDGLKATRDNKA